MNESNSAILNNAVLIELIGDEPEMARKFKIEFLQQAQVSMKKIIADFQASNFAEIKLEAHFLKTSAKAIGAEQTSDLLQALEHIALEKDKEQCKQHIIKITQSIKQVYEIVTHE